jgi:hypothetical protein
MARGYLPIRMDDLKLNAKEQRFVAEYTSNSWDAVAAARAAGLIPINLSPIKARAYTHEILARSEIEQAIDRLTEEFLIPFRNRMISQMVACLQIRAYYDIEWFYFPDGTARPIDTITPEHRWAIDKVEPKIFGKNADVREVVYTLADREAARKELKGLLDKKEKAGDQADGMRDKMEGILDTLRKGAQLGAQIANDINTAKLPEKAPEMQTATEQKSIILQTPSELLRKLKNGQSAK